MMWSDYIDYCYEGALRGSRAAEQHLAALQQPSIEEAPVVALARAVAEITCEERRRIILVDAAASVLDEVARCSTRLSPGLFAYFMMRLRERGEENT